jgi:hypothetical protein
MENFAIWYNLNGFSDDLLAGLNSGNFVHQRMGVFDTEVVHELIIIMTLIVCLP